MALKTNSNMAVHGLDGVHASFANGVMTLYFLEAKLTGSAKAGISSYAESVSNFGGNRKQYLLEYELLHDLSNLNALDEVTRELALQYFDVYGARKEQRLERSVGVIVYSETALFSNPLPISKETSPAKHQGHFSSRYIELAPTLKGDALDALTKWGVAADACEIFFVAVPSTDDLRRLFDARIK